MLLVAGDYASTRVCWALSSGNFDISALNTCLFENWRLFICLKSAFEADGCWGAGWNELTLWKWFAATLGTKFILNSGIG